MSPESLLSLLNEVTDKVREKADENCVLQIDDTLKSMYYLYQLLNTFEDDIHSNTDPDTNPKSSISFWFSDNLGIIFELFNYSGLNTVIDQENQAELSADDLDAALQAFQDNRSSAPPLENQHLIELARLDHYYIGSAASNKRAEFHSAVVAILEEELERYYPQLLDDNDEPVEQNATHTLYHPQAHIQSTREPDKEQEQEQEQNTILSLQILGGFIAALGAATVAVAFLVFNAAALAVTGITLACIGAGTTLVGYSLFAKGSQSSTSDSTSGQELKPVL